MSAKESRGPSVGTHTKPSGHGRRGLPTGRPSRIVGSSETAVRFARSPVAQLVERLTVNEQTRGEGNAAKSLGSACGATLNAPHRRSSCFPEFPPVLPRIPQRYSRHFSYG